MKNLQKILNQEDESGIDLTPMLDIVFIMLIFFIVTTSFVKTSGLEVNKPKASTAKADKKTSIIVGISKNGEIWLDKKPTDIRMLRNSIEMLHAQRPDGSVIISADKETPTGMLVNVMDQVKLAGVEKISIGAKRD